MKSRSAKILLIVFALSASLAQMIEMGHSMLHSINNPFHHHAVRQYREFKNHTLADHHFPKMKFAHEMDEPAAPSSFIVLAFGFVQPLMSYPFSDIDSAQNHTTQLIERDYLFFLSPPTPPPPAAV